LSLVVDANVALKLREFRRLPVISGTSSPSVIRSRREGLRGADMAALVDQVHRQVGEQLKRGAMVTITEHNVRLRRLPR